MKKTVTKSEVKKMINKSAKIEEKKDAKLDKKMFERKKK